MPVPGHDVEAYCLLCECKYEERSTTTIKVPGLPRPPRGPAHRAAPPTNKKPRPPTKPLPLYGCAPTSQLLASFWILTPFRSRSPL